MAKMRWIYTYKGTFKGILFVIALILVAVQVWYTQNLVRNIRNDYREIVSMSANMYTYLAEGSDDMDFDFLLEDIILKINIPVILSSVDEGKPDGYKIKGIEDVPKPYSEELMDKLQGIMEDMDKENEPIPLRYEGVTYSYIHYGDSEMIRILNWLPLIEICLIGLFILIGFVGFNNIRRSEQRFIWVGMAKETAHQLGTPISSLIGWVELLKHSKDEGKKFETVTEMEHD
ncbi:hypothetical protein ACFL7D_10755, partial [candidate division KSB1 bacterium]